MFVVVADTRSRLGQRRAFAGADRAPRRIELTGRNPEIREALRRHSIETARVLQHCRVSVAAHRGDDLAHRRIDFRIDLGGGRKQGLETLREIASRRAKPRHGVSGIHERPATSLITAYRMRSTSEEIRRWESFMAALFTISRELITAISSRTTSPFAASVAPESTRSTMQSARPTAGRDLHRAVEADDLGLHTLAREEPPRRLHVLGRDPRTRAHRLGIRTHREHQAATCNTQIERLVEPGAAVLEQDILPGDAEIRRAVLDERRNILRAQHEDADIFERGRDAEPAAVGRIFVELDACPRKQRRRLVADPSLRQRNRQHGKAAPDGGTHAQVTPELSGCARRALRAFLQYSRNRDRCGKSFRRRYRPPPPARPAPGLRMPARSVAMTGAALSRSTPRVTAVLPSS